MLQYPKGPEPKELKLLRSTPDANYNQSKGKLLSDSLRAALLRDQGSLCAYCQQSVSNDGTQVEHWLTQSLHPDQQWVWNNMLGVCRGKVYIEGKLQEHCDQSRKASPLFLNPIESRGGSPRDYVHYDSQGRMWSDDERAKRDIRILNLDSEAEVHFLRSNRAAVSKELQRVISLKGRSISVLNDYLRKVEIEPGTKAPPFAEFTRYLLRKWLRGFGQR